MSMSLNISGLGSIPVPPALTMPTAPSAPASGSAGTSFADALSSAINEVESSRNSADASVESISVR